MKPEIHQLSGKYVYPSSRKMKFDSFNEKPIDTGTL